MLRKVTSRAIKYWKPLVFVVLLFSLVWAVLQGYSFSWTGFGEFINPNGEFVREKTLWDWLELLIIPIFLGFGAFFLNRSERNSEREIASDRQREAAFQSYLDRMADLLLKEKLRATENKEVQDVARTRTLSVLRGLDENRKGLLLRFLQEARLIDKKKPIVVLAEADLSGAVLYNASLRSANLSLANLTGANLRFADLNGAYLCGVNLSNADLSLADLCNVDLSAANLSAANLSSANLSNSNLGIADLNGADLSLANLKGVDLKGVRLLNANLRDADITNEQLATTTWLKGAIMPDGTKHD